MGSLVVTERQLHSQWQHDQKTRRGGNFGFTEQMPIVVPTNAIIFCKTGIQAGVGSKRNRLINNRALNSI